MLIFIAVTFTWLMGLMGYVRSGLRQHWHVYGVVRDRSVDAFTPTLGFATKVVSVTVLLFFMLIGVVFWIRACTTAQLRAPAASCRSPACGAGEGVMKIPLILRIAALILLTTGFYTYVGQMVPQKEVQPPQKRI